MERVQFHPSIPKQECEMNYSRGRMKSFLCLKLLFAVWALTACGAPQIPIEPTVPSTPTEEVDLPKIVSVELDRDEVPLYDSVELTLEIDAQYSNPYDVRDISLEAILTSPDGKEMSVPGFWDGEGA